MALPSTLWDSAVKVTRAASSKDTAGQKLDAALAVGKEQADDVGRAAKTSAKAAKKAVDNLIDEATDDAAPGRGGA